MGVTDFRHKDMTLYSNFHGWRSWEWRFMSIVEGSEYLVDDFSWTYQWHCDELASLTQNLSEGMMNHRYEWTFKKITQPKQSRWWSEVSCSRATFYHKSFVHFPKFSSVICRPIPLYFLTILRRVTYAWSIIQPFKWIMYHYLII